jgi:hypothetical protein
MSATVTAAAAPGKRRDHEQRNGRRNNGAKLDYFDMHASSPLRVLDFWKILGF